MNLLFAAIIFVSFYKIIFAQCDSQGIFEVKKCYTKMLKNMNIKFSKNFTKTIFDLQTAHILNRQLFCVSLNEKSKCLGDYETDCLNSAAFKKAFEFNAKESYDFLTHEFGAQYICKYGGRPKSQCNFNFKEIIEECKYLEKTFSGCEGLFCASITNSSKLTKITKEEALKNFQQIAGVKESGKIDDATIKKMDEARCGNSDAQNVVKGDFLPWKEKQIYFKVLNFTDKLKGFEIRQVLLKAFGFWETVIPRKFYETNKTEKANIRISFAKRYHGHKDEFDGPGQILAHGYLNGELHFDDDEEWKIYAENEKPIYDQKDLLFVAVHEIGHVLGLKHSSALETIMIPFYRNPIKRDTGIYDIPTPATIDIENLQKIYGGIISKASYNGLLKKECTDYCFI